MKVTIERKQCISCGSCWDACPELFVQNDKDSFSEIVEKYRENGESGASIVIPDTMACVREAAGLCPASIIFVEE
ncbi:MAG: ferredoxin [Methanoregula sp.]|jgi:ferredoxin